MYFQKCKKCGCEYGCPFEDGLCPNCKSIKNNLGAIDPLD